MTKTSDVTFHRWDDMPKERVTDLIERRLAPSRSMSIFRH